ncbi:MAG: CBS domain-containing protein [Bacillota bacterium]|nr:CBS domain-containing protein [Bacillota bacterium]
MLVKVIMTPVEKLTVLHLTDTAQHAVDLISKNNFLSLPVVDGKKYAGYLSKQFIYDQYFEGNNGTIQDFLKKPVSDFVRAKVEPVTVDTPVEQAAHIFFTNKLRFIPVTDKDNNLVGIVTQNALFGIITKTYGLKDPKVSIYTDNFSGVLSKIADTIAKSGGNITNIAQLDTEVMGIQEIHIRFKANDVDKIVRKLEERGYKVRL